MEFDDATPWRENLIKTIESNYRRAAFFSEGMKLLQPLVVNPERRLWAYNLAVIKTLTQALGERVEKIVSASSLESSGNATDLLISLVQAVGGDAYLSGGGAEGYQQEKKFDAAGVRLVYQNFNHPIYPQRRTPNFLPGLSIIDPIMNCGIAETAALLTKLTIQ